MKTVKILSYVLISLAIVAVITGTVYFVYNFLRNGQKSFYVTYGETKIKTGSIASIDFPENETVFFTGRTLAGVGDKNTQVDNFAVSVVPLESLTGVTYTSDGKEESLTNELDFSNVFRVTKDGATFSVFVPAQLDLKAAIAQATGKDVTSVSNLPEGRTSYFAVKVNYEPENAVVLIGITLTII